MAKAKEQRGQRSSRALKESRALVMQLLKQRRAIVSQPHDPTSAALQRYVLTIELADQLREEKQELLELVYERDVLQHRITHILGDYDTFVSANALFSRSITVRPSLQFRPLTVQDCKELTSAYYSDIQRSMRSQAYVTTDQSIFGWTDSTQVNGRSINFSLQKDIAGYTPSELSKRTWQLISSPTSVYSPTFSSDTQYLQVVDEDNVVIYERWSRSDVEGPYHSLFLISRFPIESGYAEICQPLDPSRIQWPSGLGADSIGLWADTDQWILYQDCEGNENSTHVTAGGKITTFSDEDMNYWMVELLIIAMRWENLMVGPRFSLT